MEINLHRYIQSIGKTTFIYCFELFRKNYKTMGDYDLGDLIRNYDPTQQDNVREGLKMKASFARGIFRAGREKEALEICINAKRISDEAVTLGRELYRKYYQNSNCDGNDFQEIIQKTLINPQKFKNYIEKPEKNIIRDYTQSHNHYRSPQKAKEALYLANYTCEINKEHKTFISKFSQQNYVEAHHLIPMKFENKFEYSIDVHSNIVALCPNCHRAIHNANSKEQKKLLSFLYGKRINKLKKQGIEISLDELYKMYE